MTSVILSVLFFAETLAAVPKVTAPVTAQPTNPPIAITSFGAEAVLQFVELYNQLDVPVRIDGWRINFTITDMAPGATRERTIATAALRGWLLPDKYVALERDGVNEATVSFTVAPEAMAEFSLPRVTTLWLSNETGEEVHAVSIPTSAHLASSWFQHRQRGKTLTATGDFAKDFIARSGAAELYSEPTYRPPVALRGLEIHEVLAHPADCSPSDVSLACGDYIKLYNAGVAPINLAEYRLRVGYQGQSVGINTMFTWGRAIRPDTDELWLAPGQFFTLHTRNDHTAYKGQPLQLTNSGGYVWLEDAWGTVTYRDSIVLYPGTTGKQGFSWARNSQGAWRWAYPAPGERNNLQPIRDQAAAATVACRAGYYRSAETNRCRLLRNNLSVVTPCQPGQTRNPATNRCRSAVTLASTLTPCKPNQTRNLETNRCRSVAMAAGPVPCKAGQERNPETNRCRKVTSTGLVASVAERSGTQSSMLGWWIAGAVGAGALGYAVYEWRHPILALPGRLRALITRRPPAE
ncbi:MAG TPA: lamin tail domain-containing protein [Candidatus Saccharimonadales bacterium]